MQFNSFSFILLLLPLTLFAYFMLNKINYTLGKIILIISSFIFYALFGVESLIVLLASVIINYLFAHFIIKYEKWSKAFLCIPVILNVLLLFFTKYTNFLIQSFNSIANKQFDALTIIVPVGISFFTFQQIAYLVSIKNHELSNQSMIDYLCFILFFPKLLMGPLMEPADFISQINESDRKTINFNNFASGIKIFSLGLFKKIMIADVFARIVNWGFDNFDTASSLDWIFIILSYTFEIYFDFSGYSDMAVGVASMFNIELPINFDSPYKAISIRDFWKRWHISLTKFFTKYIYIPLGGSKKGFAFTCLNTMIIFLISGLWHGANWTFVLWGCIHGIFMVFDRIIEKKKITIFEPARWIITFGIVNVLWLLFRSDSIEQWIAIITKILSHSNLSLNGDMVLSMVIPEITFLESIPFIAKLVAKCNVLWLFLYLGFSGFICFFLENNYKKKNVLSCGSMILTAILFVWCLISLNGESVFVYFNF